MIHPGTLTSIPLSFRVPVTIEHPYMTLQELQQWLRMSHQTIYKLIRQGMPSHKVGKRRIFFHDEVEAWLRSR